MGQFKNIKPESLWSREVEIPSRRPLEGDKETEAAVIGAGMAGLLTAYFLRKQGKKVIVLEADRIAGGQTKNTTAKITSQHGLIYSPLIKKIGKNKAKLYAMANQEAVRIYEKLITEQEINCDFRKLPSVLYSCQETDSLKREAEAAETLGLKAAFTEKTELPFRVEGAVCFEDQAQFEPLAFAKHISQELEIYEGTRALSVRGNVIETDHGNVTADHIVFATHYPFINVPGFYFLRQHQERSYVLALSGAEQYENMYYGMDSGALSFRNAGEYLLLGGSSHRTGDKTCGGAYEKLVEGAAKLFPDCKIEARWSAQDCVTHDHIPFIGKFSLYHSNWYVATGFKKWGMTSSMVAARLITDQICEVENPYEVLFRPSRFMVRASAKDLLKDIGISTAGLIRGGFHRNRRCPHMGCGCRWNPNEQSWDCPCHGSRFKADGSLIDNPAQLSKKTGFHQGVSR